MKATSDRIGWGEAPAELIAEIGGLLGGPVTDAANQSGGYSAGLAARVGTADGRRAFVKAAPSRLGVTVDLYRREAEVLRRLPDSVPAPSLLATVEVGDWFGLLAAEVEGRHPAAPPAHRDLRAVLDVIHRFPEARGLGLPALRDELHFSAWTTLLADRAPDLTDLERRNAEPLRALAERAADHLDGDRLVHLDGRSDNVLIDVDEAVWFVDWAWACVGASWIDGLSILLDARVNGAPGAARQLDHPLFADVPAVAVDAVLAGLAGEFRLSSLQPPPPRMPALRPFQAAEARAALAWLEERGTIR